MCWKSDEGVRDNEVEREDEEGRQEREREQLEGGQECDLDERRRKRGLTDLDVDRDRPRDINSARAWVEPLYAWISDGSFKLGGYGSSFGASSSFKFCLGYDLLGSSANNACRAKKSR